MPRFALLILLSLLIPAVGSSRIIQKKKLILMGSWFEITVVADDSLAASGYIQLAIDEIKRIEDLISSWKKGSQVWKINNGAGREAVKVDAEVYDLIERSKMISKVTDGAFDISYAAMDKLWKFDGSMKEMPSDQQIKSAIDHVGYQKIELNEEVSTVFLKEQGMKIGFGGIGKGYAADKARDLLMAKGVPAGIINASGDMITWGKQPNGNEWKVAITNPVDNNKAFALLPASNKSVVTSGNYEKYVAFNGIRYSHIIDPRTGYPATGIISVTVIAPRAEMADALATAVFVMGIESGINLINQLPDIECIIIDDNGGIHISDSVIIEEQ